MGFLEVKLMKVQGPVWLQLWRVSHWHYFTFHIHKFNKITVEVFLPVYGSSNFCSRWVDLGCDSLHSPVSRFQHSLSFDLISLMGTRKVIDFQFFSFFLFFGRDGRCWMFCVLQKKKKIQDCQLFSFSTCLNYMSFFLAVFKILCFSLIFYRLSICL